MGRSSEVEAVTCCGDPYGGEVGGCSLPSAFVVTGPYWIDTEHGWGVLIVTACQLHAHLVLDYIAEGQFAQPVDPPILAPIEALPIVEQELSGAGNVWRMVKSAA